MSESEFFTSCTCNELTDALCTRQALLSESVAMNFVHLREGFMHPAHPRSASTNFGNASESFAHSSHPRIESADIARLNTSFAHVRPRSLPMDFAQREHYFTASAPMDFVFFGREIADPAHPGRKSTKSVHLRTCHAHPAPHALLCCA